MAANEYYNPGGRGGDGPLPHIPTTNPSRFTAYDSTHHLDSPMSPRYDATTPIMEPQNYQPHTQPDRRSYLGGRGHTVDTSPSQDDIPLQSRRQRDDLKGHFQSYEQGEDNGRGPEGANVSRWSRAEMTTYRRWFGAKPTWAVWLLTVIQLSVFIAEMAKNAMLTNSPIEIHPQFNPMIGPSIYVLINMGARYVPCMRSTPGIQDSISVIAWPCPNTTTFDPNSDMNKCSLSEVCGFGGVPNPIVGGSLDAYPQPNQWFRFITPIFLHAGIIHIGFNMLLQLTLGREMEQTIGSFRFLVVYISSGIFGFVMGGNFAPSGVASTGASGALFGMIALTLLDLLYNWSERTSPVKDLAFIILDIVVSFALGLLPGLDNFSHIGGFLMGLVLGVCILRSPNALRQRVGPDLPYTPIDGQKPFPEDASPLRTFLRQPVSFFKGRKPLWWVWWLVRAGALVGVLVSFIVLMNNFYKYRVTCSWCKYLSCLPIKNWCDIGSIQLEQTATPNPTPMSKRNVFGVSDSVDLSAFF